MTETEIEQRYKALFSRYYTHLLFYATRLVGEIEAEDVVQEVFVELWHRRREVEMGEGIQAFLYKAVYTRAINVLKHREVTDAYARTMQEIGLLRAAFYLREENEVIKRIENEELRKVLVEAIDELPEKCKVVFKLSYLHQMKNREISEVMNISQRTVEAHIYKALRLLRDRLGWFKLLSVLFFIGKVSVFFKQIVLWL